METITISVAEKTAEAWKKVSPNVRSRMEKAVAEQIESWINRSKFTKLNKLLDEISDEAKPTDLPRKFFRNS